MDISWYTDNQQYLIAALAEVRIILESYLQTIQGKSFIASSTSDKAAIAARMSMPPALMTLSQAFGLSEFEQQLLLLCAGVELSSAIARLCASAQGNESATYATLSLAIAAFPGSHWSALTPIHPLRRWRLIEVNSSDSLMQSRLRIDERVLHYLNGVSYLDDRLSSVIQPLSGNEPLPKSHQAIAEQLVQIGKYDRRLPVIQLCGVDADSHRMIAIAACEVWGMSLYRVRSLDIPANGAEHEMMVRLWEREVLLSGGILLIECEDVRDSHSIFAFLDTVQSLVILSTRDPIVLRDRATIRLDVPSLSSTEQQQLWQNHLPANHQLNGLVNQLTTQFNLTPKTIFETCETLKIQSGITSFNQTLWNLCRTQARTRLDDLAQRIEASADWSDLVLPDSQQQVLQEITAQVRQRSTVYETWKFSGRGANGLGITALFAGASGTGKTMAAEVIAHSLNLDLYRIDLSQVISKYIGETEKNLRRVFDAAQAGGAILLFDEADALFGKRSEVKDSHDRYANIEVSYLLQQMETYRGLAILTTNLRSAIDPAFLRRIRFIVQFPFPDYAQRKTLWQTIFPSQLPMSRLDWEKLAQLNITGGTIRNIALNAAFLAADAGEPLQMKHLLRSTQSEYLKLEKTLTDAEVGGWV